MQIVRNIVCGWSVFVLRILVTLILTPFILDRLGVSDYGLWALIISIAAALELVDFGISNGLRRYYSHAIGRQDEQLMRSYLEASATMFSVLAALIVVLTLVVVVAGPQLFDVPSSKHGIFRLIMFLLGIRTAFIFLLKPFGGVITAHQRFDVIYIIQFIGEIARAALLFLVLYNGGGIVGLAITTLVVAIAINISEMVTARKMFGPIYLKVRLRRSPYITSLFSYSLVTVAISVCDYSRGNLNNLMVSAFTDLKYVTYYAIAFQLVGYLVQLLQVVTANFLPQFSALHAAENYEGLRTQVVLAARLSSAVLAFLLVLIWFASGQFLSVWLGPSFEISYQILRIMVPALALGYGMSVLTSYLYATSQHDVYAKISVVEVVVDVSISAWLLNTIGVYGAAWGTLVAIVVVRSTWLTMAACRRIGIAPVVFLRHSYTRPALFLALFVIVAMLLTETIFISVQGWIDLIAMVVLMTVMGLVLVWLVVLRDDEKLLVRSTVNRWLGGRDD